MVRAGDSNSIYSPPHTYMDNCAHRWASHSEWTVLPVQQSFYYCQSGDLDYSVYYSGTAWYLSPVFLMGHLLSCGILPAVHLARFSLQRWLLCSLAQNDNKVRPFPLLVAFSFDKWAVTIQGTVTLSCFNFSVVRGHSAFQLLNMSNRLSVRFKENCPLYFT